MLNLSLEEALAGGDGFTIRAVVARMQEQAYERGYIAGVQDQTANLRYAMDTGPLTTPVAWFRFKDDTELVKPMLDTAWDDLRIVDIRKEETL